MDYQSKADDDDDRPACARTGPDRHIERVGCDSIGLVVELVRATRKHPDLRVGSSVRGTIDMVHVATSLAELRELPVSAPKRVPPRCRAGELVRPDPGP